MQRCMFFHTVPPTTYSLVWLPFDNSLPLVAHSLPCSPAGSPTSRVRHKNHNKSSNHHTLSGLVVSCGIQPVAAATRASVGYYPPFAAHISDDFEWQKTLYSSMSPPRAARLAFDQAGQFKFIYTDIDSAQESLSSIIVLL
jgi:hypothetical protein